MRETSPTNGVWHVVCSNPAFNEKKFQDHRHFTAVLLGIVSLFLPTLWGWDYLTDSVGAQSTIALRLSYLLIGLLAMPSLPARLVTSYWP